MTLDPLDVLKDLVRFPSVSADSAFKQGLIEVQQYLQSKLKSLGFEVDILKTEGNPIILAERLVEIDAPKLVIYGHYDVQPPDPLDLWDSAPFEPEVRGNRIYGRGAADNKGPIAVYLAALSELLSENPDLPLNLSVLLEGEEEIGSPSFGPALKVHGERIRGDMVLVCDTGSLRPDQLAVTTGLRGITCIEVNLKGADRDFHSGIVGGSILNPIHALVDICSSLHNPDGIINVPGFYDSIVEVEDWEREELAQLGNDLEEHKKFLGVKDFFTPPELNAFEATRFAPTLEFNGIKGGYQGEGSKTVIPSEAFVKISCRLVADQMADDIQQILMDTIRDRCPKQMDLSFEVEHNGNPYKVVPLGKPNSPDDQSPVLTRAFKLNEKHSKSLFGKKPVYLREGGSIPIIGDIKDILGMDTLMLGLYLPEDGAHAPNESFDLGMMSKGKELIKRLLEDLV